MNTPFLGAFDPWIGAAYRTRGVQGPGLKTSLLVHRVSISHDGGGVPNDIPIGLWRDAFLDRDDACLLDRELR